jgi:hypothetical protein
MSSIKNNPHWAICPDFGSPAWATLQATITEASTNVNNNDATQQLTNTWTVSNTAKKEVWGHLHRS